MHCPLTVAFALIFVPVLAFLLVVAFVAVVVKTFEQLDLAFVQGFVLIAH